VGGVLHVDLLKDAQLADAKGNAAEEGQNVGLSWEGQLSSWTIWSFVGSPKLNLGIEQLFRCAGLSSKRKSQVTEPQVRKTQLKPVRWRSGKNRCCELSLKPIGGFQWYLASGLR
jgi:hypothetical protein